MTTWFICKVKYLKIDEQGNAKQITEPYIVDAVSFTEAESRIYKEMEQRVPGADFTIADISRSNFEDIFYYEDADTLYKCKVTYSDLDTQNQKEKKVSKYMLVSANNIKEAYERLEDKLSTMIVPYEIPSIVISSFVDIFTYESANMSEPTANLRPLASLESK